MHVPLRQAASTLPLLLLSACSLIGNVWLDDLTGGTGVGDVGVDSGSGDARPFCELVDSGAVERKCETFEDTSILLCDYFGAPGPVFRAFPDAPSPPNVLVFAGSEVASGNGTSCHLGSGITAAELRISIRAESLVHSATEHDNLYLFEVEHDDGTSSRMTLTYLSATEPALVENCTSPKGGCASAKSTYLVSSPGTALFDDTGKATGFRTLKVRVELSPGTAPPRARMWVSLDGNPWFAGRALDVDVSTSPVQQLSMGTGFNFVRAPGTLAVDNFLLTWAKTGVSLPPWNPKP